MTRPRSRTSLWRMVFCAYALALFVATHWPKADLGGVPIPHPDKVLHVIVFAVWAVLLGLSRFLGNPNGVATWARVGGVAAVYAGVDEGLQAIPMLHRHATVEDFVANLGGVLLAVVGGMGWCCWQRVSGVREAANSGL